LACRGVPAGPSWIELREEDMLSVAFSRNSLPILVSFMILFAVIHFTQSSRSFPA
jgi:hypothetical protein